MSDSTTELNLQLAVDNDDTADYLTIGARQSFQTIDGLFNQTTGHTHSGPHQGGQIRANAFTGAMDIPDWFRSTGQTSGFPNTGQGIEMYWGGAVGVLQGYDRGANQYRDLLIDGSTIKLSASASTVLEIDASGNLNFWRSGSKTGSLRPRAGSNGFEFVNAAYTAVTFAIDDTGNVTIPGTLSVVGINASGSCSLGATGMNGDLNLNTHNIVGVHQITMQNGANLAYSASDHISVNNSLDITFDLLTGRNAQVNGTLGVGGITTLSSGDLRLNTRRIYDGGNGIHLDWDVRVDGGHDVFTHTIHLVSSGDDCRIDSVGDMNYYGPNGSTNHRFHHVDGSWMGCQAANFSVQSSVEHAVQYDKPILPIDNALEILNRLDPVHYFHMLMKGNEDVPLDDSHPGYFSYGMSSKRVAEVVPEAASGDFIDYDRLTPILWQAVKDLAARLDALQAAQEGQQTA